KFSRWLGEQPNLLVQRDTLGPFAHSEYILAAYDADRVFFAVSPQKITQALPLIREKVGALMISPEWTRVGEGRFQDIRKSSAHVAVIGEYQTAIEFKNGRIVLSVEDTLKNLPIAQAGLPQFADSNAASLWIAGLPPFLAGK